MKYLTATILTVYLFSILLSQTVSAQLYNADLSFQSPSIKNSKGLVSSFIIQPDNKILVVGSMNFVDDVYSASPVRLNPDGTRDTTFHIDPVNSGYSTELRTDGKIVVASSYSGSNCPCVQIKLLSQNGKLDSAFLTTIKTAGVVSAKALAVQKDNKVIVGALTFQNGSYVGTINRINPNGSLDNTFNTGDLKISWISLIVIQPDGKIIVTGDFEYPGGIRKDIARLHADGSFDGTFVPPIGSFVGISSVSILPNEKILVATNNGIIRLNADGTGDPSFSSNASNIQAMTVQPDGKILVSNWISDVTNYLSGHSQVLRLTADGANDASFISGAGASDHNVTALAVTASGNILVGGYFTRYNGAPTNGMVQLRASDGSVDPDFHPSIETSGYVEKMIVTTDDKLLVAGAFNVIGNQSQSGIVRFNSNGSVDNTFNIGTGLDGFWNINGGSMSALAIQNDKILAGGYFTSFNGKPANGLLRLNSDGSTDQTFKYSETRDHSVRNILVQSDGSIVISGYIYASPAGFFCKRLKADGSVDLAFSTGTGFNGEINNLISQADGKIIVTGGFTSVNGNAAGHIVRLNTDGTVDNTFVASGTIGTINKILLQPNGKLLVGGAFTTFNGNSIANIARLNPDGTLDPAFNANLTNANVQNIFIRADGKILLTGNIDFNPCVLLNDDGSRSPGFLVLAPQNYLYNIVGLMGMKMIAVRESRLTALYPIMNQTITFPPIPDKFTDSDPFTLEATASSGLPVSYYVVSGPATVSGNTVTLTGSEGTVVIRALQGGNTQYTFAPPVDQSFLVKLVTGIDNNEQRVSVYPIPASDKLTVELPKTIQDNVTIRIFDSKSVAMDIDIKKVSCGYQVDTTSLPQGLYILSISGIHTYMAQKIIIE